jgi:hypothetical protein
MVQINDDNYEDLTVERLDAVLDALARGESPKTGTQEPGRHTVEPAGALSNLTAWWRKSRLSGSGKSWLLDKDRILPTSTAISRGTWRRARAAIGTTPRRSKGPRRDHPGNQGFGLRGRGVRASPPA